MEIPLELPKHDALFWPVVRAFRELHDAADNAQLLSKVVELLNLPDELAEIPHKAGPSTEIQYRVAWVKSWLKWGGILSNPKRGVWELESDSNRLHEANPLISNHLHAPCTRLSYGETS